MLQAVSVAVVEQAVLELEQVFLLRRVPHTQSQLEGAVLEQQLPQLKAPLAAILCFQ